MKLRLGGADGNPFLEPEDAIRPVRLGAIFGKRSRAMVPPLRDGGETHAGPVRSRNEDSFICRRDLGLWAVADGAGGHQAGDFASATIVARLGQLPPGLPASRMLAETRRAVEDAHRMLRAEAASRGAGTMIVSTVVALILRNRHFACLWAGDSRAYLWREGRLARLTRDHSLVQDLVDEGEISKEEAERHPQSNIITRAVGAGSKPLRLDKIIGAIRPGDKFLLCSDGLSKALPDKEIAELLAASGNGDASLPEGLVASALERAASDNVTALVVELLAG
ncbi:MAG TPA: protein phosphatase 2C domain-containing protein [Acetobacteraceae bacterium]|nr:protein phosphatase 2C domain-containing protein [Acetobacteraceae bacterium]